MPPMVPRCPYCRAEPTAGTPVRADGGVEMCPICHEDVNPENLRAFPCSHAFCESCLLTYYAYAVGDSTIENANLRRQIEENANANEADRAVRQREVNAARRRAHEASAALRQENAALQREIGRLREHAFLGPHLFQGRFDIGTSVTINVLNWQCHEHWQNKMEINLRTAKGNIACHWAARDKKAVGNSKVRGKWQHEVQYDDAPPSWKKWPETHSLTMDIVFTESDWEVRFRKFVSCGSRRFTHDHTYKFPRPSWLADINDVVNVVEVSPNLENPTWSVRPREV